MSDMALRERSSQAETSPTFSLDSPPQPAKRLKNLPESAQPDLPNDPFSPVIMLRVAKLPRSAQKLRSTRRVRPPFQKKIIDGEERWVLPDEWIANPPPNSRALAKYAIEYSLFPSKTIADIDDESDNDFDSESDNDFDNESDDDLVDVGVAGPGPSTEANKAKKSSKKADKGRAT
ncbi:hypothetical protein CYLTODRAFT_460339 [Cylindrobasidium torrendii FP15055 ss-10]|uniref:Uncharacterized protein n=1 Tax=Cylindrobasidium torrendii FP15055 ss-10 TaxID=1314674 RepID=A0A0D7AUB2_9AGAR|nr:hypothetical protein CYLTODRAFT_460339 [Cylindrobasidium torrendii FP15055 ss-10]